jgi:hypothetical protein
VYLVVAFAVTVLVIVLAWRGVGASSRQDQDRPTPPPQRPARPPRIVAPDDDPEFLSEINRRLRGEDKSN